MASLKVVKSFTYRGSAREFSNRYYFTGGSPSDATHWTTLADAVTAAEKAVFGSNVTIVRTVGYAAASDVPVHTHVYSLAGTLTVGSSPQAPGDAAALVRYATGDRTAKNHPIYLYNYYHGVYTNNLTLGDTLMSGMRTALLTYANAWIAGFSDGTVTHVRTGPQGHTAIGAIVDTNIRHRDFPAG